MAVWNDHIEPIFPYISDMGALPPEAGFFTQLMNLCAILGEQAIVSRVIITALIVQ